MSDAPILVTAPAGNVGKEVVRALRRHGLPVRAAVHRAGTAHVPDGVEQVHFDFEDPATYAPALAGVRGLFLLRPTQITRVSGTLIPVVAAAQRAGVRQCVFLSVDGAEKQPWLPHRKVEKALEASSLTWTFLRPNHFMQNLLGPYREAIRSGSLALPAGRGRVSFVDCADLGDVTALAFTDPSAHAGRAYHLTGPEAVSFGEVAAALSNATGRRITYEPIGPLRYFRELRGHGAPFAYAAILTGLHLGVRRGSAGRVDPTLGELLDRPPDTVAAFIAAHAREFAAPDGSPAQR
ncbi:MAG: SDR family oxidoreductase [Solirubrobacteraceae bacterium]